MVRDEQREEAAVELVKALKPTALAVAGSARAVTESLKFFRLTAHSAPITFPRFALNA